MKTMKRRTKIAFIAHDCSLFGAQISLLSLLLHLDRNKFDPVVIIPYEGPFADIVRQAHIPCHVSKMLRWVPIAAEKTAYYAILFILSTPRRIKSLQNLLISLNVDIVYTNTVVNIDGAIVAKLLRKRHIWHLREAVRGNEQLSPFFPTCWIPWIVRALSDKVIVNSKWLGHQYFGDKRVASIVYNGVNPADFSVAQNDKPTIRHELGIPETSRMIVSIGSLDPRKRHDVFIAASEIICKKSDNVFALIVGGGYNEEENRLKTMIAQRELQNKIFFLGWRNDVARIISECDVLILSSDQEPFGRVLIEGMALRKPVVATRSGGPEEIIVDGETGYLVPRQDHAIMAEHVTKLLNDQRLCKEMGEAGHARILQVFSEQTYVASLEEVIAEVSASVID